MAPRNTIRALLTSLKSRFSPHSDTPGLDAQVLIAHILHRDRGWILAHPEYVLTPKEEEAAEERVSQIEGGIPLPYVIGSWEFFGLSFYVTADVLIPRPETELLVETALTWLKIQAIPDAQIRAADVGTGSGCIAISLVKNFPTLQVTASDISPEALHVAQRNARRHHVEHRIDFVRADLLTFDPPGNKFNLVCANLPYIPSNNLQNLKVFGKEPTIALDGGKDGLDLIERELHEAKPKIASNALLLFEIDISHENTARALARKIYPSAQIEVLTDLSGRPRLLRVELSKRL